MASNFHHQATAAAAFLDFASASSDAGEHLLCLAMMADAGDEMIMLLRFDPISHRKHDNDK